MVMQLTYILLVALGGALGGVGRFWLADRITRRFGESFPLGTLVVNITGAALIGMLAGFWPAANGDVAGGAIWLVLVIGALGSFTTVSAFSLQTLALLREGATGRAFANIVLSLGGCLFSAGLFYFGASHLVGGG